jgi:hypothetical protein
MTDQAIVDAVRRSRLATELSEAQMRTLADNLVFRDLRPDEVLVKEGTSDNHLYVIARAAQPGGQDTALGRSRLG